MSFSGGAFGICEWHLLQENSAQTEEDLQILSWISPDVSRLTSLSCLHFWKLSIVDNKKDQKWVFFKAGPTAIKWKQANFFEVSLYSRIVRLRSKVNSNLDI